MNKNNQFCSLRDIEGSVSSYKMWNVTNIVDNFYERYFTLLNAEKLCRDRFFQIVFPYFLTSIQSRPTGPSYVELTPKRFVHIFWVMSSFHAEWRYNMSRNNNILSPSLTCREERRITHTTISIVVTKKWKWVPQTLQPTPPRKRQNANNGFVLFQVIYGIYIFLHFHHWNWTRKKWEQLINPVKSFFTFLPES